MEFEIINEDCITIMIKILFSFLLGRTLYSVDRRKEDGRRSGARYDCGAHVPCRKIVQQVFCEALGRRGI